LTSKNFSNRPLFATESDVKHFTDRREELISLTKSINRGYNAIIVGSRGCGKTTLLHRLYYETSKKKGVIPV